ncbi:hypothetical protein SLNSH_20825 [Alsobacter soli]|uniref:Uncharacterized protein n=1 Tax=Alsobacter soli TaxID=2109933 RepID=A0A2T1HN40_9HYPH|nr:hypothetical protein [Alsobacter soli]PSC03070.1 hypothetical protein SLNSH_20825 [Alsobacter soli]
MRVPSRSRPPGRGLGSYDEFVASAVTLRAVAIGGGLAWAVAFVVVGLGWRLQTYADGALFSYAVAVREVWAFHWRDIAVRGVVALVTMAPAEFVAGWTGDLQAGVVAYGALFFSVPLLSLAGTYAADRTEGRPFFTWACVSTASLCPLVFGFPTEMWVAHGLFWPTLASAHGAPPGRAGAFRVCCLMVALAFTHEGALVLIGTLLAGLSPRGVGDARFRRAAACAGAAAVLWVTANALAPPGPYFGEVRWRAATQFLDPGLLLSSLALTLGGALSLYGISVLALARLTGRPQAFLAVGASAAALAAYWALWDHSLHADERYGMRTALLVLTAILGGFASLAALPGSLLAARLVRDAGTRLLSPGGARALAGALALVMLVHAVETAKFARAWTRYRAAVADLARCTLADPALGSPDFVSVTRAAADPRLGWSSTTPYLGVLVADFRPRRLVVDPGAGYFWLSCAVATGSVDAGGLDDRRARDLLRDYACLHRP